MNPIEAAVAPLKEESVFRVRVMASARAEKTLRALAEVDWDINVYAPYPSTRGPNAINDEEQYQAAMRRRNFVMMITEYDPERTGRYRRVSDPLYHRRSEKALAHYLEQVEKMAGERFDLYVAKLNHKIGPVIEAELTGKDIWEESFLHVTKADGSKEVWKTKTIINYSKFGLPFVQYPTRKVKK